MAPGPVAAHDVGQLVQRAAEEAPQQHSQPEEGGHEGDQRDRRGVDDLPPDLIPIVATIERHAHGAQRLIAAPHGHRAQCGIGGAHPLHGLPGAGGALMQRQARDPRIAREGIGEARRSRHVHVPERRLDQPGEGVHRRIELAREVGFGGARLVRRQECDDERGAEPHGDRQAGHQSARDGSRHGRPGAAPREIHRRRMRRCSPLATMRA
jgi:hypothetical protein